MAAVEGGFALSMGRNRFNLSEDGELVDESFTDIPTSEMRSWQLEGQGPQFLGLCHPETHQIIYDEVSRFGTDRLN